MPAQPAPLTAVAAHDEARAVMATAHAALTDLAARFEADNPGASIHTLSAAIGHLRYGPYGPDNLTPYAPIVPLSADGTPIAPV